MSNEWEHGLCSNVCGGDCGTCMGAWFCPCFLFGRLSSRYESFPQDNDETTNSSCCLWYLAGCFGVHWIPQMMRRGDVRRQFGIKGDGCTDCLVSWCCAPCSLSQMNMELKGYAEKARGAAPNGGYAPQQQGMMYQQQPQMNHHTDKPPQPM